MTDKRGEPRRRYEVRFKRQVVAETLVEGATVAAVARRHGLNANLVFNWKKDERFNGALSQSATQFLPVEIAPHAPGAVPTPDFSGAVHHFDIDIGGKVRLHCREDISREALSRVLNALRRFA